MHIDYTPRCQNCFLVRIAECVEYTSYTFNALLYGEPVSYTHLDMLERIATGAQREAGLDIADFLLMEDTPQMILQQMIERNPVLRSLIDAFGLELVDAGKGE